MLLEHVAAILFFVCIAISLVAWIGVSFYRSPYNVRQSIIYFVNVLLTRLLWRTEVPRKLPVGENQGVVLFCNHRSTIDPCFLQLAAQRVVHWLVADEFGNFFLIAKLLRFLEIIEVRRSGRDTAAMKKAIRYVSEGRALGIFPEGRINMSDDFMMPIRPGAIAIALKGKVPIVPVYIHGSPYGGTPLSPLRMPARVVVRFGEPIDLSPYYDQGHRECMAEIATRCAKEIAKLAGIIDFEPKLAGRNWKPSDEEVAELNSIARRKMGG